MAAVSNKQVSRAIATITSFNFINIILSISTTLLIINFFGVSRQIEIYFAALQLYQSSSNIGQASRIIDFFVPYYQQIKQKYGIDSAFDAFSVLFNCSMLFMASLLFLVFIFVTQITDLLVKGFSDYDKHQVESIFLYLIPLTILSAANVFMSGFMNVEKKFGRPELFLMIGRIASILTILFFAEAYGVWAIIAGLWAAAISHSIGLYSSLRKLGYQYKFIFRANNFRILDIYSQLPSSYFTLVCMQVYVFTVTSILSTLSPGIYAVYRYVGQLFEKLDGLLIRPITIVFYNFAAEIFIKSRESIVSFSRDTLDKFLLTVTPFVAAIYFFSHDLFEIVFSNENIQSEDVERAALLMMVRAQLMFLAGLNFIYRRTNFALKTMRPQLLVDGFSKLIGALLAYILIGNMGFNGLLLALPLDVLINTVLSVLVLYFSHHVFYFYRVSNLLKWLASMALSCVIVYYLSLYVQSLPVEPSLLWKVTKIAVLASLQVASLFLLAWCMGIKEVRDLMDFVRKKLG